MSDDPIAFDLDFAVRLFHDDFSSDQSLSAERLAYSLVMLAAEADLPPASQALVLSVAQALTDPDAKWALSLKRGKPGQNVGFNEWREGCLRDARVSSHVERLKAEGWKTEAAVADAQRFFCLTRSGVFACLQRYRNHSDGMRTIIEEFSKPESK